MTANEAYAKIMATADGFEAVNCVEYDTCFVFLIVPAGTDASKVNKILNGLYSVNKTTGVVRPFMPLDLPRDEYVTGKEVSDFRR